MIQQPGNLGVLRGVIHGFSEEARTRGFPSPSFGGFGFVDTYRSFFIRLAAEKSRDCLHNWGFQATGNVAYGSLAAPQDSTSLRAAIGGKAVVQERLFRIRNSSFSEKILNVRF